jgi:hypothetical protein
MEKKPRKKKVANVELENKVEAPQSETPQSEVVSLDPNAEYTFISNGTFPGLGKGQVWKMLGLKAEILVKKGYGKIK